MLRGERGLGKDGYIGVWSGGKDYSRLGTWGCKGCYPLSEILWKFDDVEDRTRVLGTAMKSGDSMDD